MKYIKYSTHGSVLRMAAVQFTLYEDLSIPEGALYSIDVLEKLNFEKPHVPRQTEDSLEILDLSLIHISEPTRPY